MYLFQFILLAFHYIQARRLPINDTKVKQKHELIKIDLRLVLDQPSLESEKGQPKGRNEIDQIDAFASITLPTADNSTVINDNDEQNKLLLTNVQIYRPSAAHGFFNNHVHSPLLCSHKYRFLVVFVAGIGFSAVIYKMLFICNYVIGERYLKG